MKKLLRKLPGYAGLRDSLFIWRTRTCRGVYATFEAARDSIPRRQSVGYDNAPSSELYVNRLEETRPSDYAAFHWLRPILPGLRTVFDLGGNVGWAFYAFQKYVSYPDGLTWRICDVPAVVDRGRRIASDRGESRLAFTSDPSEADGADLYYTAGTLQYLDGSLGERLRALASPPPHVLINRVPLTTGPTFFTVQYIGTSHCPYHIRNRDELIADLDLAGYELVDVWRCAESHTRVLFHPSRTVKAYTGMYLRRRS